MGGLGTIELSYARQISAVLVAGHAIPGGPLRHVHIKMDVTRSGEGPAERADRNDQLLKGLRLPTLPDTLQRLLAAVPDGSVEADINTFDVTGKCEYCPFEVSGSLHIFVPLSVTVVGVTGPTMEFHRLAHPFGPEIAQCKELMAIPELREEAAALETEFWRMVIVALEPKMDRSAHGRIGPHDAYDLTQRWRWQSGRWLEAASPNLIALSDLNRRAAKPS